MAWLADLVLALHFAIAAFVAAGFLVIPLGAALGWAWIRQRRLRLLHLGAILFVAAEALVGVACPLTVLEDRLRGARRGEGFIERWLGQLLYWDLPAWVFTAAYAAAALAALLLWRAVPPRGAARRESQSR